MEPQTPYKHRSSTVVRQVSLATFFAMALIIQLRLTPLMQLHTLPARPQNLASRLDSPVNWPWLICFLHGVVSGDFIAGPSLDMHGRQGGCPVDKLVNDAASIDGLEDRPAMSVRPLDLGGGPLLWLLLLLWGTERRLHARLRRSRSWRRAMCRGSSISSCCSNWCASFLVLRGGSGTGHIFHFDVTMTGAWGCS